MPRWDQPWKADEGGKAVPWLVNICINPAQNDFITVENIGVGPTMSPFKMGVALIKDYPTPNTVVGTCKDWVESQSLPAGYSTSWTNAYCCTLNDNISTFDMNPRKLRVTADIDLQVTESNESNNSELSNTFEVDQLPSP